MLPRIIYTLVFYLAMPFILLRLLWRARKAPAYRRRWGERFGFVPKLPASRKTLWVHAVSVGETLAAVPLIKAMQKRYPEAQLVVTTMTPTGSDRVKAAFGDEVCHVYAPYDLPDVLFRFFNRIRPDLLVIMETELWPNLIHACHKRKVPVILANARLSEKSAAGYQRVKWLTAPMLLKLSAVAAQTLLDGQRLVDLGLPKTRVTVTGNIKFDLELDQACQEQASALKKNWAGQEQRPIVLAASTHRGEDEIILDAFQQVWEKWPQVLLVLVPRHPERFDVVAELCRVKKLPVVRRSCGEAPGLAHQVLLGDSMGELLAFYGACDLAFVGGSLAPVGGHNLMEPATWGLPIITGPHLFNFAESAQLLQHAGAMSVCPGSAELAQRVKELLNDESLRLAAGNAARRVALANRGALERLMGIISRFC